MKNKTRKALALTALCLAFAMASLGVALAQEEAPSDPFEPIELITGSNSDFETEDALPKSTAQMDGFQKWYYQCDVVPRYELSSEKAHGGSKSIKITMENASGNLLYCMKTLETGVYKFSVFVAAEEAKNAAGSLSIVYYNTAYAESILDLTLLNVTEEFQEFAAEFSVNVGSNGNLFFQFGSKKQDVRDIEFGQVRMQVWMAAGQTIYLDDVKLTKTGEVEAPPEDLPESAINILDSGGFEDASALPKKDFAFDSWLNEGEFGTVELVQTPVSAGEHALKLAKEGGTAGWLSYAVAPSKLGFGTFRVSVDLAAADKTKFDGAALTVRMFLQDENGGYPPAEEVTLGGCGAPAENNAYSSMSGAFDLDMEYTDVATGAYTVTLRSGTTVKTVTSDKGTPIQIRVGTYINARDTDVFVDRFTMYKTESREPGRTAGRPTGNLAVNSGFEEELGSGESVRQWSNLAGDGKAATLERVAGTPEDPAYAGSYMLKMSNRSNANDRPRYTIAAADLDVGVRYYLQSQIKASEKTSVHLVIQVCKSKDASLGGTDEIVLAVETVDSDWKELSGWFEFYRDAQGYLGIRTSAGRATPIDIKTLQNVQADFRTAGVSNTEDFGANYLTADLYLDEYRLTAQADMPKIEPPTEWAETGVLADFDSARKNDWVPLIGAWTTGNGVFAQTDTNATGDQWQRQAYYRYAYRDFFAEFDMNFISEGDGWAGFSFARQKAEVGLDNGHAYRVVFQNGSYNAILYEWVPTTSGSETSGDYAYKELVNKQTGANMSAGNPAHIAVLVQDSVLTVWMDHYKLFSYDLEGADTEGYFAFNAGACGVEYRNFTVYGTVTRDAEDEKPVSDQVINSRPESSRPGSLAANRAGIADIVNNVGVAAIVLACVGGIALLSVLALVIVRKKGGKGE